MGTLSLPTSRVGRVKRGSVILPVLSFAIWCETSWHFAFGRQRQESPVSQEVTLTRSLAFQRLSMSTMPFRKNMAMKILDNQTWVQQQFANAQLGDPRRTRRLGEIATSMLDAPDQSLPQQNPNWGDLKAAYRFFDCDDVTLQAVCQPHWQQTRQTKPGRYLLISDTTDIDQKTRPSTKGMGMLGNGQGRGLQLHSCLMYNSVAKQIVGAAGAMVQYRKRVPKNETSAQSKKRIRESDLWGNLVEQVGPPPKDCQWIHVFDRGGDYFEAMCKIQLSGCDFVIRASKLNRKVILANGEKVALSEAIQRAEHLGDYDLSLRSRPGVKARTASMKVSKIRIQMPLPRHHTPWAKQCGIKSIAMTVVIVQEIGKVKGSKPIRWVLLTSLKVNSLNDAWQVITDYEDRWLIEEYHKVIKTGCAIESHALRSADRLEPMIGLISVLGIRLFQLKLVGRVDRTRKAKNHVPSSWLRGLKLLCPKLALSRLTVYEFLREVAKLGGFLARKHDGEPGWQTIWRGHQKLKSIFDAERILRRNEASTCG